MIFDEGAGTLMMIGGLNCYDPLKQANSDHY